MAQTKQQKPLYRNYIHLPIPQTTAHVIANYSKCHIINLISNSIKFPYFNALLAQYKFSNNFKFYAAKLRHTSHCTSQMPMVR